MQIKTKKNVDFKSRNRGEDIPGTRNNTDEAKIVRSSDHSQNIACHFFF